MLLLCLLSTRGNEIDGREQVNSIHKLKLEVEMNITKEAYGEWISSLAEWEWFATFTFKYPTSPKTANRLWRKHWLRSLEKAVNGQVHFVRVLEESAEGDRIHYHCLLAGIKEQKPSLWERAWHDIGGIAQIKPYTNRGGAHYVGGKSYRGCDTAYSKNIEKVGLCA